MLVMVLPMAAGLASGRADNACGTWKHPHTFLMVTILPPVVLRLHVDDVIVIVMGSLLFPSTIAVESDIDAC